MTMVVVLTDAQCDMIVEALADDDARKAEVLLCAVRFPADTFTLAEGFTKQELAWVSEVRALAAHHTEPDRFEIDHGAPHVWEQVLDHLAGRIEAGEFTGWLPARHALAYEYGVSVHTVDRAIRRLARHGVIRTFPGKGTAIAASA